MVQPPRPEVRFRSYNPYEARYPGRRVVSRDTLHLIKQLRGQGYRVIVEPNDGTPLNYIAEKGFHELLSDPVIAMLVGIPINIATNLFSNWAYDRLNKKKARLGDGDTHAVLEFDEQGRRARYDQSGAAISDERFGLLLASLDERARRYHEVMDTRPPDPARPIPLQLEHTDKIVGWAQISVDEAGLKVDGGHVFDDDTRARIESGELKGFSIAALVKSAECSICHGEYVECDHIANEEYGGRRCTVALVRTDLAEISIVKEPVNPAALLQVRAG